MQIDLKHLHDAMLDAFPSRDQLQQLLRFELDVNLDHISSGGSLRDDVFRLVEWAHQQARIDELVAAMLRQNPSNPSLVALTRLDDSVHRPDASDLTELRLDMPFMQPDQFMKKLRSAMECVASIKSGGDCVGTGIALNGDLLLSSRHVFSDTTRGLQAELKHTEQGNTVFQVQRIVFSDSDLDIAVVRLDAPIGVSALRFKSSDLKYRDPVTIVQASDTELRLSFGVVVDVNTPVYRMGYTANTTSSSGGAPIFDEEFNVVGMHLLSARSQNSVGLTSEGIRAALTKGQLEEAATFVN